MEFRVYHTLTSKMSLPLPSHIMGFDIKSIHTKEFKPQALTHHVFIIVIIVIIAMLTLCYFIMSRVMLIL